MTTATETDLALLEIVVRDAIAGDDEALAAIEDVAGWGDVSDTLTSFVLSIRAQIGELQDRGYEQAIAMLTKNVAAIEDRGLSGGHEIRVLVGSPGYLLDPDIDDLDDRGYSPWWSVGRSWRKMWNGKYSLHAARDLAGKRVAEWHGEDGGTWAATPHIYH